MPRFTVLRITGLASLLVASACGGAQHAATAGDDPHKHVHGEGHGPMDIRKAALPFKVLRGHGGAQVAEADFFNDLATADAVCVGESHKNPHHHWVQLMVLEHLIAQADGTRTDLALGMEMFQRPFQGVLDDYEAGKIDEKALLQRTGWADRWGYDYDFYRPMVEDAVKDHRPVLALNAPKEITSKVGHAGLGALSPDEKKQLPELKLDDEEHRAWFREVTDGHASMGAEGDDKKDDGFENFYTAQVIWDETMADTVWQWLHAAAAGAPRHVVILAGTGHCMDAAIPRRLARRGAQRVVSIQAVLDDGSSAVSDLLAAPENDYVIVLDATGGGEPEVSADPHE
jgi:uncharacterized iron-regulated protein